MKFRILLLLCITALSLLNCKTDNSQPNKGAEEVAFQDPEYQIKFKIPNAPIDSSVYFQLNNDDSHKFYLNDERYVNIHVDSKDIILLVAGTIKTTLTVTVGLNVVRQLHLWLTDPTYIFDCNASKELRGIVHPGPDYPISGVRVTNMSTTVHSSVRPNPAGIYKMCFSGPTLQYKYALDNHSNKIEMQLSVPSDPDMRIDVYLTDDNPVINPNI